MKALQGSIVRESARSLLVRAKEELLTVLQYNIEPSSIQSRNAEGSDSQEQ